MGANMDDDAARIDPGAHLQLARAAAPLARRAARRGRRASSSGAARSMRALAASGSENADDLHLGGHDRVVGFRLEGRRPRAPCAPRSTRQR